MATAAKYMPIIGANRIVSFVNLTPTAIPPTLEAEIYPNNPGVPQVGNRKIAIKVKIEPVVGQGAEADDLDLILKVKVPDGALSAPGVQTFDATTPQLDYFPRAKLIPQNMSSILRLAFATPIVGDEDVAAQTVDILIRQAAIDPDPKEDLVIFVVEIDWSHSIIN